MDHCSVLLRDAFAKFNMQQRRHEMATKQSEAVVRDITVAQEFYPTAARLS